MSESSSPTGSTLVKEHFHCYGHFLRLSEFPDLFVKVLAINLKFSLLDLLIFSRKPSKQNKFFKRFKWLLLVTLWVKSKLAGKKKLVNIIGRQKY